MKIKRLNQLNENLSNVNINDFIIEFIDRVTGDDLENFKKASYKQIDDLHSNASSQGIYYSDEYLIFLSESTYKNWQYYGGYEYIDDMPDMIVIDGDFCVIYAAHLHDRVSGDLDFLNNADINEGAKPKTNAHAKLYRKFNGLSDEKWTAVWKDIMGKNSKPNDNYDIVKLANHLDEDEIDAFIKKHKL